MKQLPVLPSLGGFLSLILLLTSLNTLCRGEPTHAFVVSAPGKSVPFVVSAEEPLGVPRAVSDFQQDIKRVTGRTPEILPAPPQEGTAVIIGTLGHSELLDRLIRDGKINPSDVSGRWEAFLHQVVENPFPGMERALVIAGSDRRGTIFGLYTLSEEFGVSPWYWWADVPVIERDVLEVSPQRRVEAPTVRYRGVFLNDEAPALSGWAAEKFGGINSKMYVHVFELLLRLRANFLWPAMWDNAFYDDDPMSPVLAHEYGIVMGTSHHEPMMRAHKEWTRYGSGEWNYATNDEFLRNFWRSAIVERKPFESIITLAMRGDGDEAMSEDTNVALLERIVTDQREILATEFEQPLETVPQVWALYKEVQDYYERGMRVPEDVTLLWCDDNWGNIRRLPTPEERQRSGGAGVYYHFDYVGGPRSYKWLNVQPLSKIWEQMHLAWKHEATRIWIVNVGDLKPMEYPIDFFLTMAWDPAAMPYHQVDDFSLEWAAGIFGKEHAPEIAHLLEGYTRLNRQRTPEMMSEDTYSLVNYREAERIEARWQELVTRSEELRKVLPEQVQDAFYQLVHYPVKASSVVRRIHIEAGRNDLYALQGRVDANEKAEQVRHLFRQDQQLADAYHSLKDNRWNHMMDQINLGYTYWNQPPVEVMPDVHEVRPNEGAVPGLAIEGSTTGYPVWGVPEPKVPTLDRYARKTRWIELFNRGNAPFAFTARVSKPWIQLSETSGTITGTRRIEIGINWSAVPHGHHSEEVILEAANHTFTVQVPVFNPASPDPSDHDGYVETDGHIVMEAPHYSRTTETNGYSWLTLPDHGHWKGGVTLLPVTAPPLEPDNGAYPASLEFDFYNFSTGVAELTFQLAPSLDIQSGQGLRFAYSIDDGEPIVLPVGTWSTHENWQEAVARGVRDVRTKIELQEVGRHKLKVWAVTPAVVFQRFIIDFGGLRPSYLGPPESPRL